MTIITKTSDKNVTLGRTLSSWYVLNPKPLISGHLKKRALRIANEERWWPLSEPIYCVSHSWPDVGYLVKLMSQYMPLGMRTSNHLNGINNSLVDEPDAFMGPKLYLRSIHQELS